MKKIYLYSIITILALTSASIAWAGGITPTGPQCTPDNFTDNQTCPYCPIPTGATFLHLKWKLSGNYSKPYCTLHCSRTDGLSCDEYSRKDANGYASSLPSVTTLFDFRPIDDVKIAKTREGNIYKLTCIEADTTKPILVQSSPEMKVVACNGSCEIPFKTIINNFDGKMVPTIITESSFNNWSQVQALDSTTSSGGMGSGDKQDLIAYIAQRQTACGSHCIGDALDFRNEVVAKLEETLGSGKPTVLSLSPTKVWSSAGHAVVGLKILRESDWSSTTDSGVLISGKKYEIEILDPNGPGVKTLDCKTYNDIHTGGVDINGDSLGLTCPYEAYDNPPRLNIIPESLSLANNLYNLRNNYCNNNHSDFCTREVADYLETNYPAIDNPVVDGGGCCAGWSDFVLTVGYLGDFIGTDWHPQDMMGVKCDVNYKPKAVAKSNPTSTSWLASFWTATTSFLSDLKYLKYLIK